MALPSRDFRRQEGEVDLSVADHDFTFEMKPSAKLLLDGVVLKNDSDLGAMRCRVGGLITGFKKGAVYRVRDGRYDDKADSASGKSGVGEHSLLNNLPER